MGKGGIIGVANEPTLTVASGIWRLLEAFKAKKSNTWPLNTPPITFVAEASTIDNTAGDHTVTIPAGASVGDLCILYTVAFNNGIGSISAANIGPSGGVGNWTTVSENQGSSNDLYSGHYYKILESGDPGSTVTMQASGNSDSAISGCAVFTRGEPLTSIGGGTSTENYNAGLNNPDIVTTTASASSQKLVVWGAAISLEGTITADTMSPTGTLIDPGAANDGEYHARYLIQNASPVDTTLDVNTSGSNDSSGGVFYLELII